MLNLIIVLMCRFFPEKAATLARGILDELIKETKIRPLPIVLAAFSGGSKGCLYKLLQLVEGKCEGQHSLQDDYQLLRLCLSGQMYDSSPVDFTSDLGVRFVLQPSILRLPHPPRVLTWMAKAFASSLDALFINRFETERAEYWKTLYSSVSMGPFLILCSEDDELVPCKVVCGFAQHLKELGGDINLMIWSSSPHVAHYRYHKAEYKAAVTDFLAKASLKYSRMMQLPRASYDKIPEPAGNLKAATLSSDESPRRAAMGLRDRFISQTSMELVETIDVVGSLIDQNNFELFQLPSIKPHKVLNHILSDVCVPKNIEDWDIKKTSSLIISKKKSFSNIEGWDIKFIKRSRL